MKQILSNVVPGIPVWIFGSRITGTAKPCSDLDLIIIDQDKLPLTTVFTIQDAFEESTLPYRVDVLDWHRINSSFRKLIEKNHVVLIDSSEKSV